MNYERYQRQIVLPEFGVKGQEKLLNAKVLVVGAGGLGVPVLQYLTAMGVGKLGIVDGDVVSLTNLQRQVIYRTADIGLPKAEVAISVLSAMNPEVEFESLNGFLTSSNAIEIISEFDLVVDCTDNIEVRYVIDDTCKSLNKPWVYGALYKYEGQVSVFNFQGGSSYRDVYPDDQARVQNCAEIGVLGVLPGIIGTYQAMEVVKVLTGIGDVLSGRLLIVDALRTDHYLMDLPGKAELEVKSAPSILNEKINWIDINNIDTDSYELIDIRPESQFLSLHDDRFINVPFAKIFTYEPEKDVILVCDKGQTTQQAAVILKDLFPHLNFYQIAGGYQSK